MAEIGAVRTCPVTGFSVFKEAERLIKANAVTAVVALLVGGIAALMILLTRVTGLLSPPPYYLFLAEHAWNMLIFWIIFFEVAILYFAGSVMLSSRLAAPKTAWFAFLFMVVGAVIVDLSILRDENNYLTFAPYPPLRATPEFYLGANLFAVGAVLAVIVFFATIYVAKKERAYQGSLPLVVYGAAVAAVLTVGTLLFGVISFVPAFLWSADVVTSLDPFKWKLAFWGYGHASQQINLAAMISIWYLLAYLTVGGTTPSEWASRFAFVLYVIAIQLGSAHHQQTEPTTALSAAWKFINTGYLMHIAVLASFIHAFAVPGAVERGMRGRGYVHGLFEWVRKAPWGNPAFSSLVLSVTLFGFLAGTTGVIAGTEQINLRWHNTMGIPGHFHATVVAGTTMAFMGITWYVLPLIFRRKIVGEPLAKLQPWLYGFGLALLTTGFMWAGVVYGLPRRQPDIFKFGDSPLAFTYEPGLFMALGVAGLGGLLAIIGGALFVLLVVGTVLAGKKLSDAELVEVLPKPPQVRSNPGHQPHVTVKGTFVLALIFWVFFAATYLGNWLWLSRAWPLGR